MKHSISQCFQQFYTFLSHSRKICAGFDSENCKKSYEHGEWLAFFQTCLLCGEKLYDEWVHILAVGLFEWITRYFAKLMNSKFSQNSNFSVLVTFVVFIFTYGNSNITIEKLSLILAAGKIISCDLERIEFVNFSLSKFRTSIDTFWYMLQHLHSTMFALGETWLEYSSNQINLNRNHKHIRINSIFHPCLIYRIISKFAIREWKISAKLLIVRICLIFTKWNFHFPNYSLTQRKVTYSVEEISNDYYMYIAELNTFSHFRIYLWWISW